MANTLGVYNPIFYAQEALVQLEKALGMASRVYMGYDTERRAYGLGETINIRRPATFTVGDAPATAQDVTTETVSMTLDKWREVKFKLTDKELAFTGERIINDHIRPAAYALADDIDQKLIDLSYDIGNLQDATGSAWSITTIPQLVRKPLFDAHCPLDADAMHIMVGGQEESELLSESGFVQMQGAGDQGVTTQMRGTLGRKFGFEVFANQNVASLSSVTDLTDTAGAVNGAVTKNTTSVSVDGLQASGTILRGTGVTFAGDDTIYAVAADAAITSNAATITLSHGLKADIADNAVATFTNQTAGTQCLGFHKNAFGLVMAPLSEMGNELGANVATVSDPVTGLSLRSRVYYVGNSSEVHVALDVLYGVKTLDPRLAVRVAS
jgi:hypothetical protein